MASFGRFVPVRNGRYRPITAASDGQRKALYEESAGKLAAIEATTVPIPPPAAPAPRTLDDSLLRLDGFVAILHLRKVFKERLNCLYAGFAVKLDRF